MRASPSIRAYLFLLMLFAVLPVLGFAAYVSSLIVERDRSSIERGAMERARALLTAVDAELRGSVTTLQGLATSRALDIADLRSFHAETVRVLASQRDWLNIGLTQPSGTMVVNARVPYGQPVPVSVEPGSVAHVVRTGEPTVGGVVMGNIQRTPVLPVRVPVTRDGKVQYVLSAAVKPGSFEEIIRRQNLPKGWVIALVDADGRFVARLPAREPGSLASEAFRNAIRKGSNGWFRGVTSEGADTFTAYHRSDYSQWAIGFAIPTEFVEESARRTQWLLGLGAFGAILLALLLASLIGRRISGPLMSLAGSARLIGQGHEASLPPARVREVGVVAAALAEAGAQVRAQRVRDEKEKEDLLTADRAKDQFIAMLSHELRNPLAALSTAAQVLRLADPAHEAAARARGVVERQVAHMTRLVEDLLDINRVVMGKAGLVRESFDLAELSADVVRIWRDAGRLASHRVEIETTPARVHADRARMDQILSNLLDNAIKFTPTGRAIRVSVRAEDGEAVLEVADEGEGLVKESMDSMFDLFVQGPQGLDRRVGGLGVGLALVKRLVELHGGRVAAHSDGPGKGSRFTVRLPAAGAAATPAVGASAATASARNAPTRILIVEDNEDAREMVQATLSMDGHTVHTARDGREALTIAAASPPEVMVVDIGLPDMTGLEVAQRVRATPWGRGVRLIALSGYGQPEDLERARAAGFDAYLTKPVSTAELLRAIAEPPR